jgi:phenylacetate-CoA ligase
VVLTNGETVLPSQRSVLEEAFGCSVRETYGMCEMVAAASECEHGRFHFWPEPTWPEVFDGNRLVLNDQSGDLVFTGLLNFDMPLIRYRIGDRGRLPSEENPCACGRTLRTFGALEGRIDDIVYTRDGRVLSPNAVDIVFDPGIPLREAQIIQESLDHVRLRYVPANGFGATHKEVLAMRLRGRFGDVEVSFDQVDRIPRGPNGKFKVVASNVKATAQRGGTP